MSNIPPNDIAIALFLQREKVRIPYRYHRFIDDMVSLLDERRKRLTPNQRRYLHGLFIKFDRVDHMNAFGRKA